MSWDIENIITELKTTLAVVTEFRSIEEPGEALPPDGPFCLIEHIGGPIDLGNLEEWVHGFRITAGVSRNGVITLERKAVRGLALAIIAALRANVLLSGEAGLMAEAELGISGEMNYAGVPFVGCSVTVRYQTSDDVVNSIHD